ncbi:LacI family DNA-binding transcriptional regulator [Roseibacterium sp. SDUM158017]|uniref:LacI family DNA-binding transcriptional regulator n=1 Tax=Roseicyclus salinarum TaxID=3036773 RepID=UPI002414DFD1|nr:LacI family DNA-binding transcriptional regulator [Roseibacterium sp. SDUM158017]MDG4649826.1 LacI family DNA-binding transcriptional regulator [Roseibacterium sp. SDUM158017]
MKRRPTITDVAARAGVSKSTVSLVLQGSPQVRAETAALVRAAMGEMGYVYNRAAATLRGSSVGLVGLVINDLRNPFFTEFAASLQMALASEGYATVISNSDEDPALQSRLVATMIEHGVDAVVICPAHGDGVATFEPLARAAIPTLQVLRRMDARTDLFPFSSFDYAEGSMEATRHLIGLGARRIAFVGGLDGLSVTQERMAGYSAALAEAGLPPLRVAGPSSRAFGLDAAARLAAEHPDCDGVLCFNDLVALGLLAGLMRAGAAVGDDIRLVGFDDIEDCALSWPQLSSVSCDIAVFARDTAATLLRWLSSGVKPPPERRAPVHLVARASSLGGTK